MKIRILNFGGAITILLLLAITSCQKVVELNLKDASGQLVIEAKVTNANTQTVKLSRNVAFTSTNDYPAVSGATVTISDQTGKTYQLTEGSAGTYSLSPFRGISLTTYNLNVQTDGKTYTASSMMPARVALDSIFAKSDEFNNSSNQKNIWVAYADPAGVKNQYRFVMYVNGVQVKRNFSYNDDLTDGRYVNARLRQFDIDIYPGDTVRVEMQCIDPTIYKYWETLQQQQGNGPGGGVTPSNPPTNLSNNALGYFSAHTTQTRTLLVK
jgi:hypothetical protein